MITKTVHEAAFGYPSALGGILAGLAAVSARNPAALAPLADYTQRALTVCKFSSEGIAGGLDDFTDPNLKQLAWISCSPLASVFYWSTRCQAMLSVFPTACTCIDPAHGENGISTTTKPCCTQAGVGCLATVPGYVSDALYVTQEQYDEQYDEQDVTTQNTGCGDQKKGEEFAWSTYLDMQQHPLWARQGRPLYQAPSQQNIATFNASTETTFYSPVTGTDGTRARGRGRTSKLFSDQISDGKPHTDYIDVYITQSLRAQRIFSQGSEDFKGVLVNRFAPREKFLEQNVLAEPANIDNGQVGVGTPESGLADITYMAGFPAYISRPYYFRNEALATRGISLTRDGQAVTPNADEHETYLLIDPASGMALTGHKRLQASFALYKCESPAQQGCRDATRGVANVFTPNVKGGIVIPQYYMDETSTAPDDSIDTFKKAMSLSLATDVIVVIFPIIGGIVLAVSLFFLYKTRNQEGRSVISVPLMGK
jgi:hypothetical protein